MSHALPAPSGSASVASDRHTGRSPSPHKPHPPNRSAAGGAVALFGLARNGPALFAEMHRFDWSIAKSPEKGTPAGRGVRATRSASYARSNPAAHALGLAGGVLLALLCCVTSVGAQVPNQAQPPGNAAGSGGAAVSTGSTGSAGSTASPGAAAPWPTRNVVLVVPAVAGGGLDAIGRALAVHLSEEFRKPVVVENQPGADGLIATQRVINATPDGHTLLLQIPALIMLKHTMRDLPFDPATALMPVSELGRVPTAIAVSSKLPVNTFADLVRYCNAQPTPCTSGTGQAMSALSGKRVYTLTGLTNVVNVSYKGTAPVITDVLGGHITIGVTSVAAPLMHYKSGAVRVLAVNSDKRYSQMPDVPTFREAGIPMPPRGAWYGMFAPLRTPDDVLARIERGVTSARANPAVRQAVEAIGAEPVFGSRKDFVTAYREEDAFLAQLVEQYPLK